MNIKIVANISFFCGISILTFLVFYTSRTDIKQKQYMYHNNSEIELSSAEIKYLDKQNNISKIEASKVTKEHNIIKAKDINFSISRDSGNLIVCAKHAKKENDVALFYGDVIVIFDENTKVTMDKARAVLNERKIYIDVPVNLQTKDCSATSKKCNLDWDKNEIYFYGNVNAVFRESKCVCNNAIVSLDSLKKYTLNRAVLHGNVVAKLPGYDISAANKITITKDMIYTTGITKIKSTSSNGKLTLDTTDICAYIDGNNKISKILCKNSFIFSTNDNIIKGSEGILVGDKIIIKNKLRIISKNGEITGESGEYDLRTKKAKIFTTSGVFLQPKKAGML